MKGLMQLSGRAWSGNCGRMDAYKFDHFQLAYPALKALCLVPMLVHGGRLVIQSSNVAENLNDRFPDPLL